MFDPETLPDGSADEQAPRAPLTSRRTFPTHVPGADDGPLALGGAGRGPKPAPPATDGIAMQPEEVPPGKDPASFTRHSGSPLTLETRREALGTSDIVPYELLFVRNNLPTPDPSVVADRDAWTVAVEGVRNPRAITVGELRELGLETVAAVLQCAGNGRKFFPHRPSGAQWGVGAAGCVVWSGVPVRLVAQALGGVEEGARFVTATGGEALPEGVDPRQEIVERSIPLTKGMEDALLAWQMNGEPLPLVHGGPLRLIVPGYYGVNQVKWVKRLAFTPAESDARIMRTLYRLFPIGGEIHPSQPTMWEMPVKSWITHPSGERPVRSGPVVLNGVAFGGTDGVRRVEVSTDGGQTWQAAPFVGPDRGKYAWRQFALTVTLEPGTYTLVSRATDAAGNTQPAERTENQNGYGNQSWRDHAVTLTVV